MTLRGQKLCDVCKTKLAVYHIADGHTGNSCELCETCYAQLSPRIQIDLRERIRELIKAGICKYCGAPATTGTFGFHSSSVFEIELWCEPCRRDLAEFGTSLKDVMPKHLPFHDSVERQELIGRLGLLSEQQEEFMKQRVLARKKSK